MRRRWLLLNLLAPIAAIAFSVVLSSLMLWAAGYSPFEAWNSMIEYGTRSSSLVSIVNRSVPLFIAGLAVAMGFKMNLFNIGVEGQYRMAALVAAAFGAWIRLPAPLHIAAIIVVSMLVGAAWASIPAVLKATRGVHEVISSIMLNTIATGMGAYLLSTYFKENRPGDLVPKTKPLPASGQMPSLNGALEKIGVTLPTGSQLRGFVVIAVLLGIAYYYLVWRTRFGYDLRAAGVNPTAAEASGVRMKSMSVRVLLLSGAIAGLIGIGDVLGFYHSYSIDFPSGLGFTGIGVALLGRNHPVGIAAGALLFAFLDRSAQILDARGIPREISTIMQGIILLSVVIAYEVVRRIGQAQETRAAAEATKRLENEQHREPAGAVAQ